MAGGRVEQKRAEDGGGRGVWVRKGQTSACAWGGGEQGYARALFQCAKPCTHNSLLTCPTKCIKHSLLLLLLLPVHQGVCGGHVRCLVGRHPHQVHGCVLLLQTALHLHPRSRQPTSVCAHAALPA